MTETEKLNILKLKSEIASAQGFNIPQKQLEQLFGFKLEEKEIPEPLVLGEKKDDEDELKTSVGDPKGDGTRAEDAAKIDKEKGDNDA